MNFPYISPQRAATAFCQTDNKKTANIFMCSLFFCAVKGGYSVLELQLSVKPEFEQALYQLCLYLFLGVNINMTAYNGNKFDKAVIVG